jgi:hypothetical protein
MANDPVAYKFVKNLRAIHGLIEKLSWNTVARNQIVDDSHKSSID